MRLELSCSALLAIATVSTDVDAFISPLALRKNPTAFTGSALSASGDDFVDALKGMSGGDGDDGGNEEEEVSQGGSRFKEMMAASQREDRMFRPIENPFLNPTPTPPAPGSASLDNLSVEDQARMFRQLMQQQQSGLGFSSAPPPAPPARENPRPVGRNRDTETIANTSDLYFAQLKRDSTVRGIARIRGESDKAEAVFEDEGIRQLEDLLHSNPYLKGQREKEKETIEAVPEEVLLPYFESDTLSEEEKSTSGISYKEIMKQRRNKKRGGRVSDAPSSSVAPPTPVAPIVEESPQVIPPPPPPPPPKVEAKTAVEQPTKDAPPMQAAPPTPEAVQHTASSGTFSAQQIESTPVLSEQPPAPAPPTSSADSSGPAESVKTRTSEASSDDLRQKIRTLMGMTLKHRGGLGFGKGRLQGPDVDSFENLLEEVTGLLKEEAMQNAQGSYSAQSQTISAEPKIPADAVAEKPRTTPSPEISGTIAVAPASPSDAAQVDSMIACIEGAIMMYKNSPPEIREGVLFSLRGALNSALNTIDKVISRNVVSSPQDEQEVVAVAAPAPMAPTPDIDVSPPLQYEEEVEEVVFQEPEIQQPPVQETVAVVEEPASDVVADATSGRMNMGTDANSKVLEEIYNEIKSASGDGRLGLKKNMSQEDASRVANSLEDMRSLLMQELETGIPDPEPSVVLANGDDSASSSAASKYQEMLAKARAAKASS